MNLKQVGGDMNYFEYGGVFATKKLNNSEFDYWLFVEFINMYEQAGADNGGKYMITIKAVSPSEPSDETKNDALDCLGLDEMKANMDTIKPFEMANILNDYGTGAVLFSKRGNNAKKLFNIARTECEKIKMMFGFYMDKQQNMIGNSGWDFIKGEIGI